MNRVLPVLRDWNRFFWTGGEDGRLRFQHCTACDALQHPAAPVCRRCGAGGLDVQPVSGRGVVQSCTVNVQRWSADQTTPFVVAVVAIDEDPRVRLTTNVVGCDPDAVHVGLPVRVVFEHVDDVWVPLFEPAGGPPAELPDECAELERMRSVRPMARSHKFEDDVALTGVGRSRIGRKLGVAPLALTVEAIRRAVADAGLAMDDIDGLSTYPASPAEGGYAEGGVTAVESVLGLRPTWHNGGHETPGACGSLVAAMLAVSAGLCRHVVCFRTVWQSTFTDLARRGEVTGGATGAAPRRVSGPDEHLAPYGVQAVHTVAMAASQHMARYGTTREALGWIALNARANAALDPTALYREPLTMDEYLAARVISTPFGLYDCDALCDGAVAVVVSAADAAAGTPHPVLVEAVGMQVTERMEWDQGTLSHEPHVLGPAAHLWTRTTLRPDDIDVAELYDGFTFNCLSWIEALGFCEIGEAKDFLDGGRNIARDGLLPLNTHGGQLSHGRTHGMGLVHEAVTQLRGDAGPRQVDGAATAVVTSGGLTPGGVVLLRRDR
ncbi:MAG TPA: OB-fold domain-containing protein [Acidimicrobiales bacterium]|nr:OB-fold domain-containing protein [Acidimicrobiales bacterium]